MYAAKNIIYIKMTELSFSDRLCLSRIQRGECSYRVLGGVKIDPDFLGSYLETFINSLRETLHGTNNSLPGINQKERISDLNKSLRIYIFSSALPWYQPWKQPQYPLRNSC